MLEIDEREEIVSELAKQPGHEKVRYYVSRLLVDDLGADNRDIYFERPVPEVHGRIDALLGRTVFEFKSNLKRERQDAVDGLTRYLTERESQTGEKYVGIATDGADFIAYFLKGDNVVEVGAQRVDPAKSWELTAWLRCVVVLGDGLSPDPHTIIREFGRESLAARRALDDLDELWSRIGKTPEALLKQELWDRFLGLAYGARVGDDALFLQHTYLAVIAKAIAWAAIIETPPEDASALLHGDAFSHSGITGQSEPDFFDWVLATDAGEELVMRIYRHVNRFRLQDISVDILKALYESLIDPETRHDLGEYYTPDWLAARMVEEVVDKPLEQRVMDPSCGSGTFLFHAVRAVLDAARASGMPAAEAARLATEKVAGIDVHPVAVIIARVTYLLALMPALREEHPGAISLPVYLGDSLQWNLATGRHGDTIDMFNVKDTLEISVPMVEIPEHKIRYQPETLRFPSTIASDMPLFERVLSNMIDLGSRSEPVANFIAWIEREASVSPEDSEALEKTYEVMLQLQNEGRNHIWGYVARNLARPVWLSSETQKADVVIGNPPWVSYRYMSGEFKKRFRRECDTSKLWVGGNVATHQDLSSYFFMRAAFLYMRRTGRIALVMPHAAMSGQPYKPFRKGEVARFGYVRFRLRFTQAWAFGPEVKPLFKVPSCVLFAQAHSGTRSAPLPEKMLAFSGALPRRDADESEARENLSVRKDASWPTEASVEIRSHYRQRFRQGATLVPRRFVLVEFAQASGMLQSNPEAPQVRGRARNQDKQPWKTLEPPEGVVDRDFLRPVFLGESIAPFRVVAPLQAVIPWDNERRELLDATKAASRGYPRLARWLEKTEKLWELYNRSAMSHKERIDYHGELSCQFPIAPIRVVYSASGTNLASCVVQDEKTIIESKLYWSAMDSLEEAHYLCGIFNSEVLRAGVEPYQSQGQWGARDIHKYVFNLPIPKFDGRNSLHQEIADAAKTAEDVARAVPEKESEYFVRTRKRVRDALAEHGISEELESFVGELLKTAPLDP